MPATTYSDEVVACPPRAGTLYDVLELILDRGMVIDVFVRVSLVGIEILKIDARIVVASVDTYLRFAEACNRLDLERDSGTTTVPELLSGGDDDSDEPDEDEEEQQERPRKRRAPARGSSRRRRPVEA
ncbi:gas vesicle protein GvpJ [Streptomyces sp. NPDC002742]|uniref:gas vesicle protein GvpJ n=1 Tax=Streptomyces sp. NPDC002742 TaxID=3364663 RepID=UPI0036A248B6